MNDSPSMTPTPVMGNRFRVLRCPSCNLMESSNFPQKAKVSSVTRLECWGLWLLCIACGLGFWLFLAGTMVGFSKKITFIPERGRILDSYWILPFAMLICTVMFSVLITVCVRNLYKRDKSKKDDLIWIIYMGVMMAIILFVTVVFLCVCAYLIRSGQMALTFKAVFTSVEGIASAVALLLSFAGFIAEARFINTAILKTPPKTSTQPEAIQQPSLPSGENKTAP